MDSFSPQISLDFSNIVCSLKFFLILDNSGNRIYCSYFPNNSNNNQEFNSFDNQKIFEKKLCEKIIKSNIDRVDIDIINFQNYDILCKVNREVNIFIGINEGDNEVLLETIYNAFEAQLFDLVHDDLSREKIFRAYDKLVVLIDELIYQGIALNLNQGSLNERIFEKNIRYDNEVDDDKNKNGEKKGNFFTNLFGF